jgi:hypothetical protein
LTADSSHGLPIYLPDLARLFQEYRLVSDRILCQRELKFPGCEEVAVLVLYPLHAKWIAAEYPVLSLAISNLKISAAFAY